MKGSIRVFNIEISGVDAGVIISIEALIWIECTGRVLILSPAGAVSARARMRENNIYLIMVIYLLSYMK